jgi:hypothetical protein
VCCGLPSRPATQPSPTHPSPSWPWPRAHGAPHPPLRTPSLSLIWFFRAATPSPFLPPLSHLFALGDPVDGYRWILDPRVSSPLPFSLPPSPSLPRERVAPVSALHHVAPAAPCPCPSAWPSPLPRRGTRPPTPAPQRGSAAPAPPLPRGMRPPVRPTRLAAPGVAGVAPARAARSRACSSCVRDIQISV